MSLKVGVVADSRRVAGGGTPLPSVVKSTILGVATVGPVGATILAVVTVT